ncbi:glycosyltransferase family 9 protein [Lutibacter sp.]|uniref:glycosyltransferase family 9 protein n=1 Tax=Lutibacter sp. TaxID=1925666 RepID=UPI0039AF6865
MTVPVIRAFIKQHPSVKITVLSKPFLKPLFADLENVTFYTADVKGKHKGFAGIYKLFKELKSQNFTEIADLHNVLRSIILRTFFKLSFVKTAYINKGRAEKKALTRSKNKIFKQLKTSHERYADVFRNLGYKLNLSNPTFPAKQNLVSEIIELTGIKKQPWVGIAPFAQYQSKMYPLSLMKKVIEELSKNTSYKILLFGGGKKEVVLLNEISTNNKNTINIAGNLSLEKELALISNLDVMLSMDSGNAHFAAMLGVKTITLWGVTHPFAGFAPFNQPSTNCLLPNLKKYPNIPCSIYGNKVFEGYENVMESITPKKVVNKIIELV